MKFRNLLIFGAALLSAGAASAAVTERQAPEPKSFIDEVVFDENGKTEWMYMYNTGAKKFFTAGNAWSTQTSIGDADAAYKVYFEKFAVSTEGWTENTVLFYDSCEYKGAIKNVFFDTADGYCYTDRGSQANYYWNLQKVGDSYRLSMSAYNANYEAWNMADKYFGVNDTLVGNTCVWSNLEATEPHSVDWKFVTESVLAEMESDVEVYKASQPLYTQIVIANGKGLDVAAQEAVYNNAAATVEELEAATAAVQKAIAQYDMMNVDPNNPEDKTSSLVNPDYSDGKVSWTDTNSDQWAVSYNVSEHYDDLFQHYQKLQNVASGVYALTVRAYCRPVSAATAFEYYNNGTGHGVNIFAVSGADTLEAEIPNIWAGASEAALGVGTYSEATDADGKVWYVTNNMQGAEAYFNDEVLGPKYDVTLFFGVEADSMTVGIKQDALIGDDWVLWDNWRLQYYGGKAEAYQMWLNNLLENIPAYDEETLATAGMVDAYNAVAAQYTTAATYAEVVAAQKAIYDAAAAVDANVAAWTAYEQMVEEGKALGTRDDLEGQYIEDLVDYCELDAEDILAEMSMTTEEVLAESEKLAQMIEDAKKYSYGVGSDVTDLFLVNADFSQGSGSSPSTVPGWQGTWGAVSELCMEAYGITFDAYQEVSGAGVGIYEVTLQGFFRIARDQEAYNLYLDGGQVCPASVYVNNNKTGMKCVFDEPVAYNTLYTASGAWYETVDEGEPAYWYPNTMQTAGEAFVAGMYQSSASGIVAKEGDVLRLGVKGELGSTTWAIWDNFKMVYWGKQADKVQPHLETAIAAGKVNLESGMASDVRATVEAAIKQGEEALTAADGETMFDALVALYASNDSVEVSMALFAELEAAASALMEAASYSESADKEAAMTLADEALAAVEYSSITNAQAREYLSKIAIYTIKVKLPANMSTATDDNLADVTAVIASADFGDAAGANSDAGWSYSAQGSFGNDDTQKAAMAYEYYQKAFDLYQDIPALPAGTYTVTVDGFSRNGSTDEDYALWKEGVAENTTYLYAMTTDSADYRQAPVAYYASGASAEALSYDGEGEYTAADGTLVYLPGSMVSAAGYMSEGLYSGNKVTITIQEGQTLRIGMKKAAYISNDWVIIDNWKLYYHGAQSAADGIEEVAVPSQAAVVKSEVYSISGAQLNGLQKGLNIIKTTLEDGTVVIKKTYVK